MSARVLFVDQSAELGGGELSLLDLVLRRRDRSKVLLLADGPFRERLDESGVAAEVVAANGRLSQIRRNAGALDAVLAVPSFLRLARRIGSHAENFDVLYANSQKAFVVSAAASMFCGKPLIWHLRDMLTRDHFSWLNRNGAARLANFRARFVIANSAATASAFTASGGRAGKLRVIHNGIDPAPFDAIDAGAAGARLRAELGCGGATLIGSFSRLAEWKGQHVLIEALAELPAAHAILVGGSFFGAADYERRLRGMVGTLGLGARVHFLGFRDDIPALMKAVDIVVHSSVAPEPFGRVVVEGMIAGKPVLASRGGGVTEIVTNSADGLLFPPGDAAALARCLRRLIDDPALAQSIAARARDTAIDRFSADACSAAVESVIAEAARQHSH